MADLNELVNSWGLQADLGEAFEQNAIKDLATLEELLNSKDDLATVVPCIGTRMRLKNRFKQHIQSEVKSVVDVPHNHPIVISTTDGPISCDLGEVWNNNDFTEETILSVTETQQISSQTPIIFADDQCLTVCSQNIASGIGGDNTTFVDGIRSIEVRTISKQKRHHPAVNEGPQTKKKTKFRNTLDIDVTDILEQHPLGPTILAIYEHTQQLDSQCQSYMCDIIVTHFLQILRTSTQVLTNEDFEQLAEKIVEIFPNECKETYYVSPVKKKDSKHNKSAISKGKLVDKYRNKLTFIRRAKNLANKTPLQNIIDEEDCEDTDAAERSRIWLLHNRNERELLQHWTASYSLRTADCKNDAHKDLTSIFNRWPILKEGKGYELVDSDFGIKYPDSKDLLIENWETFFDKLCSLKKKSFTVTNDLHKTLLGSTNLSIDSRTAIQLYLLPELVAPKSNKISVSVSDKGKRKTFWKPSVVECREGLVIQVKVPGDIQNVIREKREKMLKMGLSLQPFIIVVGTDITKVEKAYISIDETIYEVPTLLKAVDILFKTFLAFEAKYPLECEHLCYLIQWGIYNIYTVCDTKIPFVYTVLNQLKKLK